MKILITGGTGFVGREIVHDLSENNQKVIALGNKKKSFGEHLQNVEFHQADITEYRNLSDLEKINEVNAIIHSAGLAHQFGETTKREFDAVNVTGTVNILKLAVKLQVKHFILIGSTSVYKLIQRERNSAQSLPVIDEEFATEPLTLYAQSKLESEKICRRICEENNIPLTIFRLAPVIGEENVGNVARLISAIDKNRFIWIGNGENFKSLIYKRDVARACTALLTGTKQNQTEVFNLAAEPVKMSDFVNEIAARLNKRIIPISIPESFLRTMFALNSKILKSKKIGKVGDTVEKWLSNDIYSADKIARIYGFRPQTTVSEAIVKQVDHYKTCKMQVEK